MSEKKTAILQNPKKNILWIILAIAVIAVVGYSFLTSDLEVMEDKNGPDDYSLAIITEDNIINLDMGSMGLKKTSGMLSEGITFSSDNFNGVERIFLTNFIFSSDFRMDVTNFHVNSGNFRMCLVNDGEIVYDVQPGETFNEVLLRGLKGDFELIIAGESADFTFYLDRQFCDHYGIKIDN